MSLIGKHYVGPNLFTILILILINNNSFIVFLLID